MTDVTKTKRTYVGQEARIVRAYIPIDGRQSYALKTMMQTLLISTDKTILIDFAEDHYLKLTEIAD
ncbi:MAG: hypothetical protein DRP74_08935 [Candidatus Omnitrophota bacterium]|nr:MAG: hypothetical protein DRP74_08935 [Candidatus Omnitrophota bacterium]